MIKTLDPNAGFYEKRKKILFLKEICKCVSHDHWVVWMNDEDFVELIYQLMMRRVKIDSEIVLDCMMAVYKHKRLEFNRQTKFRFGDSRKAIHELEGFLGREHFNKRKRRNRI